MALFESTYAGSKSSYSAAMKVLEDASKYLGKKYGFDGCTEYSSMSVICSSSRGEKKTGRKVRASAEPPLFPVPFCGVSIEGWCNGVRPNGGLYTQCSADVSSSEDHYCATCRKQASKNEHGKPNGGDIAERVSEGGDWRDPKGRLPTRLANMLKKTKKYDGVSDESVKLRASIEEEAAKLGVTIPPEEWSLKATQRGRPRKKKSAVVDTTASEDGGEEKHNGKKVMRKKSGDSSESDGETIELQQPSCSTLLKRRGVATPPPLVLTGTPSAPSVPHPTPKGPRVSEPAEGIPSPSPAISPVIREGNSVSISPIAPDEPAKPRKDAKAAKPREDAKAAKAAAKALKEAAKKDREAAKAAKAAEKEAKAKAREEAKAAKAAEKEAKAKAREEAKAAKAAEKEAKAVNTNKSSPVEGPDPSKSFKEMKIAELKAALKGLGLQVGGKKSELIERLEAAQAPDPADQPDEPAPEPEVPSSPTEPAPAPKVPSSPTEPAPAPKVPSSPTEPAPEPKVQSSPTEPAPEPEVPSSPTKPAPEPEVPISPTDLAAKKRCDHVSSNERCSSPVVGDSNQCAEHDIYDAETENEEDSDDEGVSGVEEFEHGGVIYLRDPDTNELFDKKIFDDTGEAEEVGTYDPKTDKIEFLAREEDE